MSVLDEALEKYLQDDEHQSAYYDLVLNTDFYIPITDDESASGLQQMASVSPAVFEAEGKAYLMLFDSEERLSAWAGKPTNYIILAGFKLAEISTARLHWAVNIGGGFAKEFVPDEIKWLQEAVAQEG